MKMDPFEVHFRHPYCLRARLNYGIDFGSIYSAEIILVSDVDYPLCIDLEVTSGGWPFVRIDLFFYKYFKSDFLYFSLYFSTKSVSRI